MKRTLDGKGHCGLSVISGMALQVSRTAKVPTNSKTNWQNLDAPTIFLGSKCTKERASAKKIKTYDWRCTRVRPDSITYDEILIRG
eukprot:scaffold770_cov109-Cylindrotheca_fusiformis.AAC.20